MSRKTTIFSVFLVLILMFSFSGLVNAQSVAAAKEEQAKLLSQQKEIATKMMKASENGDHEAYNTLKAEFETLDKRIVDLQEIINTDVEGRNKVNAVKKLYSEGYTAYKIKRFTDATSKFNQAITDGKALNDPTVMETVKLAYIGLAYIYNSQTKYVDMIAPLEEAIKIDPNDFVPYYLKGSSYGRQGKYTDAIAAYQQSITLNGTKQNITSRFNTAVIYFDKLKEYDKAIEFFNSVLELEPQHGKAWKYLGRSYLDSNKYKEAEYALTQATVILMNDYEPFYKLSELYNKTGKYTDAITAADNAMKFHARKAKYGGALIERGKAFKMTGNNARALEDFEAALGDRDFKKIAEYEIEVLKKGKN
ncbi:tetratricopeptide repeat protein [candidate division KSB1 bacterium]